MMDISSNKLLNAVRWNGQGLVAAIAQDWKSNQVLMLAWMNPESLSLSLQEGRAVYWSRSRQALWRKGESSGNVQRLHELHLDCDGDTLLLKVEQVGGIACHTGRQHCFYRVWQDGDWQVTLPVLKSPEDLYGSGQ